MLELVSSLERSIGAEEHLMDLVTAATSQQDHLGASSFAAPQRAQLAGAGSYQRLEHLIRYQGFAERLYNDII
jgi:hypothetical protein